MEFTMGKLGIKAEVIYAEQLIFQKFWIKDAALY